MVRITSYGVGVSYGLGYRHMVRGNGIYCGVQVYGVGISIWFGYQHMMWVTAYGVGHWRMVWVSTCGVG